MTEEYYFVTSDGIRSLQIFFDFASAKATDAEYIESFDINGNKLANYRITDTGQYTIDH